MVLSTWRSCDDNMFGVASRRFSSTIVCGESRSTAPNVTSLDYVYLIETSFNLFSYHFNTFCTKFHQFANFLTYSRHIAKSRCFFGCFASLLFQDLLSDSKSFAFQEEVNFSGHFCETRCRACSCGNADKAPWRLCHLTVATRWRLTSKICLRFLWKASESNKGSSHVRWRCHSSNITSWLLFIFLFSWCDGKTVQTALVV